MRKLAIVTVAILAVALVGGQSAYANYCARDVVPAATLLVPYASVGLTNIGTGYVPDANKPTTLFSMTNVSATAQIVHVTVWNALSVPEIDFDVILSGYDTWQINFRDLLAGNFTAFDTAKTTLWTAPFSSTPLRPFEWGPNGQDARDTGYWPGPNVGATLPAPEDRTAIGSLCGTSSPPYGDLTSLSGLIVAKFTGPLEAYAHAGCGGVDVRGDKSSWLTSLGVDPVFFYVTADVATRCSTQFPDSETYFAPGGVGGYDNVLIGDIIYFDPVNNYSEMFNAVAIEATQFALPGVLPGVTQQSLIASGGYYDGATFYGFVDGREPLGTAFGFRYADFAPTFSSTAIVWKNKSDFTPGGDVDDCVRYLYYAFDDNEHSMSRTSTTGPSGTLITDIDPNQFPFETQKVTINKAQFDVFQLDAGANKVGWMMLVFPPSYGAGNPFLDETNLYVQAWVGMTFQYNIGGNKFSAGSEAALLGNYHCWGDAIPELNTYAGYEK